MTCGPGEAGLTGRRFVQGLLRGPGRVCRAEGRGEGPGEGSLQLSRRPPLFVHQRPLTSDSGNESPKRWRSVWAEGAGRGNSLEAEIL